MQILINNVHLAVQLQDDVMGGLPSPKREVNDPILHDADSAWWLIPILTTKSTRTCPLQVARRTTLQASERHRLSTFVTRDKQFEEVGRTTPSWRTSSRRRVRTCFRSFSVKLLGASFRSFSVCSARRTIVLSDAGAKIASMEISRRGVQPSGIAKPVCWTADCSGSRPEADSS